ncbi:roadblock/LC7 domain-containing protein [Streptomyces sp. NPDC059837]|jgi:predicted regulator of Ras-like GTPase activity (Roadblock/LC7/MglB family)|uniref:roadblock/LC7 domain-containing protein n=1 Tax=unclassified Streptomyces TaxID=2593676 RepID=UPI002257AFDD|nr:MULTISPECIES: roadblock/LC7 domain-containing protein [unclassified Streptomyces]MCX4408399.1 roadblock/LC7 domain-containing protein [Streptomyces sp. NBC_01764]MCX4455583.1 roadblock/LC7 domain-containing protein [Streptomyces sp. NBC_01719]MCX4494943.1 roadblock/LC7 domain-containing protein [Streptomyces sp. NBC_01728]MCX4590492.1 roadblock/LC7 domain-containing protein [Streptomyces sp. NBC_01549]MCX5091679.1 roadblock/LC7 domain-containing protein [Streptomyces sp. NBC_00365]
MTLRTTATNSDLDWLLDRLVDQVPGTRNAIVLSDDGLVVSQSSSIERVDAERLAAIATGQQSLARGVGDVFGGGPVHQVIIELRELWLFVSSAGRGTHLAVVADQEVDAEVMSVAMHTLVQQVGQRLGTEARVARDDAEGTGSRRSSDGESGGGRG